MGVKKRVSDSWFMHNMIKLWADLFHCLEANVGLATTTVDSKEVTSCRRLPDYMVRLRLNARIDLGQPNLGPHRQVRISHKWQVFSLHEWQLKCCLNNKLVTELCTWTSDIYSQPPEQGLHSVDDVSKIKGQRHAGVIHTPKGPVHWGLLGG